MDETWAVSLDVGRRLKRLGSNPTRHRDLSLTPVDVRQYHSASRQHSIAVINESPSTTTVEKILQRCAGRTSPCHRKLFWHPSTHQIERGGIVLASGIQVVKTDLSTRQTFTILFLFEAKCGSAAVLGCKSHDGDGDDKSFWPIMLTATTSDIVERISKPG